MATFYKRQPEDEQDHQLLRDGWEFRGVGLFWHPTIPYKFFIKEDAIEYSMEQGLGLYCPVCGACGIDGCCPPDMCKCLHGEEYKKDYGVMVKDWDKMYNFIKGLSTHDVYIDKHLLANQAQELIDGLGE